MAVEFEWEIIRGQGEAFCDHDSNGPWQVKGQMNMTTRIRPIYQARNPWQSKAGQAPHAPGGPVPWAPLTSEAFRPKRYTLRLEKGRFTEPSHNFEKKPFPLFQADPYRFAPSRYAYRITFDKSPFPPLGGWAARGCYAVGRGPGVPPLLPVLGVPGVRVAADTEG